MTRGDASEAEMKAAAAARAGKPGGLFLVFEGVEGSGKSTQVERLAARCRAAGRTVVVTREPGGTPLGEEMRRLLLHGDEVPPRSELLLYLAARAALVDGVVKPALERGAVVIADRFELSTLAYQGFGRDLALEDVAALNAFATAGLKPDATVLLDLDPAAGRARRAAAGADRDRIEREPDHFHERVARAYRELSAQDPTVLRIEARGTVDEVEAAVIAVLRSRFPETFPEGSV